MNSAELDQLDKLMAEVMGWEARKYPEKKIMDFPRLLVYFEGDKWVMETKDWQPSRLLGQAMMVLGWVQKQPFSVKHRFLENLDSQSYLAEEGFGVERSWWFFFIADQPEAICLAVKAAWQGGDINGG